jgi:hypothetical protein
MSNISNPLQLRADRPLDPDRHATLAALDGTLKRLKCPYMRRRHETEFKAR